MRHFMLMMLLISSPAIASELQFQYKSPSFNGVGYSAHVLTIENLEATRRQKIADDKKAAAAAEAQAAKNTKIGRAHV